MTTRADTRNMALFCDFENVALGVKEARYAAFDIRKVLERLLLKGSSEKLTPADGLHGGYRYHGST